MNAHKFAPRGQTILVNFLLIALFASACQGGGAPAAAATLSAADLRSTAAALESRDAQIAQACSVGRVQGVLIDGTPYPCPAGAPTSGPTSAPAATSAPAETPSVSVAPTAAAPLPAGMLVSALQWTPWDLNNLVIPGATVVRPTKPFEGEIPMPVLPSTVYQLKTDLDDTDPAGTWKPGSLVYEYDVPSGWQPQYLGSQGDTSVQLCWQREEKDGNNSTLETQVLLKTQNGNGASVLVAFLPVSAANVPPVGSRCSANN